MKEARSTHRSQPVQDRAGLLGLAGSAVGPAEISANSGLAGVPLDEFLQETHAFLLFPGMEHGQSDILPRLCRLRIEGAFATARLDRFRVPFQQDERPGGAGVHIERV